MMKKNVTEKRRLVRMGITGAIMTAGLIFASCASLGTARLDPPDGTYSNYSQGSIVFDAAGNSWKAESIGYKGSFDYREENATITLIAEQELKGFRWADITPMDYAAGQLSGKGKVVTLGDYQFRNWDEE
jgi:hypothetical protein